MDKNLKTISYKQCNGWIPDTDIDGVDIKTDIFGDVHNIRGHNGFITTSCAHKVIDPYPNVAAEVLGGYEILSVHFFELSENIGKNVIHILWNENVTEKLKIYINGSYRTLDFYNGNSELEFLEKPNNINYNVINDSLRINLNCQIRYGSLSTAPIIIGNFVYCKVGVRDYNQETIEEQWALFPRWLSYSTRTINIGFPDGTIPNKYDLAIVGSIDSSSGIGFSGNGKIVQESSIVIPGTPRGTLCYYIGVTKYFVLDFSTNTEYTNTTINIIDTLKIKVRSDIEQKLKVVIYDKRNSNYLAPKVLKEYEITVNSSKPSLYVYQELRNSGNVSSGDASYARAFDGFGQSIQTIELPVYLKDVDVGVVVTNVTYSNAGDVAIYGLILERKEKSTIAVVGLYDDGQRALLYSGKYDSLTDYESVLYIADSDIDYRIKKYEVYMERCGSPTPILTYEIEPKDFIRGVFHGVAYMYTKVFGLLSIYERYATIEEYYNLPYDIFVNTERVIHSEVAHKGRVYFVNNTNKIYQSHIGSNLVIQADAFPYIEAQGFGYFTPDIQRKSRYNKLAISGANDMVIFTKDSMYVYYLQPGNGGITKQARRITAGIGYISGMNDIYGYANAPVLFWCDYNGIYMYQGGTDAPECITLGVLENYWRAKTLESKRSAIGFYVTSLNEYWLFIDNEILVYQLYYKQWYKDIAASGTIYEYCGIDDTNSDCYLAVSGGGAKTLNRIDILDKRISFGLSTHFQGNEADHKYDKILQEFYIIFGDTNYKELNLVVFLDNLAYYVGAYKIITEAKYFQMLLPPLRFKKLSIQINDSANREYKISEFGITYYEDYTEPLGVVGTSLGANYGSNYGNNYGVGL